jgi:hypothetical protein
MPDVLPEEPHGIPLREAIRALRAEIAEAMDEGQNEDIRFEAGDIDLEFQVEVRQEKDLSLGANIYFFVLHAGAAKSTALTHKVKMTLKPGIARKSGRAADLDAVTTPASITPASHPDLVDEPLTSDPYGIEKILQATPQRNPVLDKVILLHAQRTAGAADAIQRMTDAYGSGDPDDMLQALTDVAASLGVPPEVLTAE